MLLPVPVTLQSPHSLDSHGAAQDGRLARYRGLLQPPVLLQSDALSEFGDQSHPLQFNVDQIQGGLFQAVLPAADQTEKEENVGTDGNIHDRVDQLQQQPVGLLAQAQQQQELQREGIMQRQRVRETDQIAFTHGCRGREYR